MRRLSDWDAACRRDETRDKSDAGRQERCDVMCVIRIMDDTAAAANSDEERTLNVDSSQIEEGVENKPFSSFKRQYIKNAVLGSN